MKNRVKELRGKRKITQEELAALIGISRQAINAIEKITKYLHIIYLLNKISKDSGIS